MKINTSKIVYDVIVPFDHILRREIYIHTLNIHTEICLEMEYNRSLVAMKERFFLILIWSILLCDKNRSLFLYINIHVIAQFSKYYAYILTKLFTSGSYHRWWREHKREIFICVCVFTLRIRGKTWKKVRSHFSNFCMQQPSKGKSFLFFF